MGALWGVHPPVATSGVFDASTFAATRRCSVNGTAGMVILQAFAQIVARAGVLLLVGAEQDVYGRLVTGGGDRVR